MNRQTLRHRERLRAWRPDYRDSGLEWMLAALCAAVPVLALLIVSCGGPGR